MKAFFLVPLAQAAFTSPTPAYTTASCSSGSTAPGDASDTCGAAFCIGGSSAYSSVSTWSVASACEVVHHIDTHITLGREGVFAFDPNGVFKFMDQDAPCTITSSSYRMADFMARGITISKKVGVIPQATEIVDFTCPTMYTSSGAQTGSISFKATIFWNSATYLATGAALLAATVGLM